MGAAPRQRRCRIGGAEARRRLEQEIDIDAVLALGERLDTGGRPTVVPFGLGPAFGQGDERDHDAAVPMGEGGGVDRHAPEGAAEDADFAEPHGRIRALDDPDQGFGFGPPEPVEQPAADREGRPLGGILRHVHAAVRPRPHEVGIRRGERPERGQGTVGRRGRAGKGHHAQEHRPAVQGRRQERQRRRRHHRGDGGKLLGRRLGGGDEAAYHLRRRRQYERAAGEGRQFVQAVLPARHDAEIAAAAAQRPEQVGVVGRVGEDDVAGGGHDFGGEHRIDGQPVLAHEIADAAAERDAANADTGGIAEADDQPVLFHRPGQLARGEAGPGPDRAGVVVDRDGSEIAQVDEQARVRAVAAVAAAAHGYFEAGGAGEAEHRGDVLRIGDPDHGPGPQVVVARHEGAKLVVVGVVRQDDPAGECRSQRFDLVFKWEAFVHGVNSSAPG